MTILLALLMFDKFSIMNVGQLEASVVPLVGVVCLQLSVKIHERSMLNSEQTISICKNLDCPVEVEPEMLLQVERNILLQFGFSVNLPTAADLLLQLVFLDQADDGTYLSWLSTDEKDRLVERSMESIFQCQFEPSVAWFSS